jgi:hypothetical protein
MNKNWTPFLCSKEQNLWIFQTLWRMLTFLYFNDRRHSWKCMQNIHAIMNTVYRYLANWVTLAKIFAIFLRFFSSLLSLSLFDCFIVFVIKHLTSLDESNWTMNKKNLSVWHDEEVDRTEFEKEETLRHWTLNTINLFYHFLWHSSISLSVF